MAVPRLTLERGQSSLTLTAAWQVAAYSGPALHRRRGGDPAQRALPAGAAPGRAGAAQRVSRERAGRSPGGSLRGADVAGLRGLRGNSTYRIASPVPRTDPNRPAVRLLPRRAASRAPARRDHDCARCRPPGARSSPPDIRCEVQGGGLHGRYPNADHYQILAYCTALSVPMAWLVYAQGSRAPAVRRIKNTTISIVEYPLDLRAQPRDLLRQVEALAQRAWNETPCHAISIEAPAPHSQSTN